MRKETPKNKINSNVEIFNVLLASKKKKHPLSKTTNNLTFDLTKTMVRQKLFTEEIQNNCPPPTPIGLTRL